MGAGNLWLLAKRFRVSLQPRLFSKRLIVLSNQQLAPQNHLNTRQHESPSLAVKCHHCALDANATTDLIPDKKTSEESPFTKIKAN